MGSQRIYLWKYISVISYVLRSCYNRTKSQELINILFHDLRTRILFGSKIAFKCVPETILEKLVTHCYADKAVLKNSLQIHKCLFISQETLNKLQLNNLQWILVNVMTTDNYCLPVLHCSQIVVLDSFHESECLLTSTNLFNLCNCNHSCKVLMLRIIKPLIDYKPKTTQKVSISIVKPLVFNEDSQIIIDKAIFNYISLPKFVSVGDILKLDLNKCYPESKYLVRLSNVSIIYIKIIELEGINKLAHLYNCKSHFYITNLQTKLIEVKCLTNTYLPEEREYGVNNLEKLSINNYNDFILKVFPGGMKDDGELLVSWIKPFIQQKHTGDLQSHF